MFFDNDTGLIQDIQTLDTGTFNTLPLTVGGTMGLRIPAGLTVDRTASPSSGDIRFNTDLGYLEGFIDTDWSDILNLSHVKVNPANTVVVQTNPATNQFSSIKDAIDSISGSSAVNPYLVIIYPGLYVEDASVLPEGVFVAAVKTGSVLVVANDASEDIFTMGDSSGLRGVTLTGAGTGRAVIAKDVQNVDIDELSFNGNQTDIYIEGDTAPTSVALHDLTYQGSLGELYCCRIISTGGQSVQVSLNVAIMNLGDSTALVNALEVSGTGARAVFHSTSISAGDAGVGLYISDGATVSGSGLTISDVALGLHIPNIGAAPNVYLQLQIVQDDAPNILVEHTGTLGFIAGAMDHDEITIATGTTNLSLAYNGTDASEPGDVGFAVVGSLLLGSEQANTTDVTDLIQQSSPTGVLSGGVLTPTGGLDISISAGYGYLIDSTTLRAKRVSWAITPLTLTDNTQNYVYIDNSGVPVFGPSIPDSVETILLARIRTDSGGITFLASIPLESTASATYLDEYVRTAIGALFGVGCIVTEDVTPYELDVTSGTYYYSKLTFTPSAAIAATFVEYYHIGGTFTPNPGQTIVNNTDYDDGVGLTPLTPGYFAKHALYVSGDGAYQVFTLVISQAEYNTLLSAEAASIPTPPSYFTDITVPIAAIIVQEGATNIIEIQDIRPRLGFTAPSVGGTIRHGDLLGLGDDDHTQYLLVSGTRAMSGDLDMGANDITNVGLVDGVDVSAHGGRHGANSADPIATAAPITTLTPSTLNAAGIANTLSRSDHTHAISGFQPLDSDLTALAAIATTGIYVITGSGTSTTRSLVQPAAGITISNSDGVAGNPTFALANDLAALEGLSGTGFAVRTAVDTWTQRSIVGTTNRITVSDGDGVAANPAIDIAATYVGQTSITTLGTITTGVWNGSTVGPTFGGTGLSSYAQGDILYASAINTLTQLAKDTNATRYLSNTGASNNPAWAQVSLTSGVTGTLPLVNGGTGNTTGLPLNNIIAATGTNSINNGDNAQAWNWALTTAGKIAFTFTENTAAINGVGSQYLMQVSTVAASTANPFGVITRAGNTNILVSAAGAVSLNGSNAAGAGTGQNISITGGTTATGTAGSLTLSGGVATGVGTGGSITIAGGTTSGGTAGTVAIQTAGTNRLVFGIAGDWTVGGGVGTSGQVLTSAGAGASPTWATVSAGTVTSVSGGTTGLTFSTPTTTPTMTGTLIAANGGTGFSSYAVGDVLYAATTSTLAKLADVAAGSYLRSGGVGVAPLWSTTTLPNSATTGDLLYASASNVYSNLADIATGNALISGGVGVAPSWGKIGLTTHVTGTLPLANGGTGTTTGLPLNNIIAATGSNSINNGDNAQTWNWALTTAAKSAFTFTENTAAVNGVASQFLVEIATIASSTAAPLRVSARGTPALLVSSLGSVVVSNAALATNATDGFLYIPTSAGTPTGTPTTFTGRAPIEVDTTNNRFYFYSTGAWRQAGGAAFIQRFTYQADQLDSPVTSNWAVNARAAVAADTVNSALTVRRFDDTTEEGVGGLLTVPTGATNVTFYFKGRAQTSPGGTVGVVLTYYTRLITGGGAVGAWSGATNFTTLSVPTGTNFQYYSQTISLATLGWTVGNLHQFEITRRGTQGADTLTGDWDLVEMIIEFT